ncbi:MAG TPA: hypothetical protein VF669_04310 [Tepidisphaeraceae bacterium]
MNTYISITRSGGTQHRCGGTSGTLQLRFELVKAGHRLLLLVLVGFFVLVALFGFAG